MGKAAVSVTTEVNRDFFYENDSVHFMTLRVIHTYIYPLMAVAAMEGATSSSGADLGFNFLAKDTSTCKLGESTQRPLENKTPALPLSHRLSGVSLQKPWDPPKLAVVFYAIVNTHIVWVPRV